MQNNHPEPSAPRPSFKGTLFAPLLIFLAFIGFVTYQMIVNQGQDPSLVPNALAGKTAPQTPFPYLFTHGDFDIQSLKGQVLLVNFWGSWCSPCREEHATLMAIAQDKRFHLIGVNYKDNIDNARKFLKVFGNPFTAIGSDPHGIIAIDWGVYGPPETFLISKDGRILYKHIGPLNLELYHKDLLPRLEQALKASNEI
ncbi:DsbE family thiol:disulfide interchange protein [Bartonella sp. DGB2]|uniref:DsbE family thiol:disulfide interchange protein n=1 Tax=Bartonella sp. DGB2 TaxID=3388426 RepID=UPI00398FA159